MEDPSQERRRVQKFLGDSTKSPGPGHPKSQETRKPPDSTRNPPTARTRVTSTGSHPAGTSSAAGQRISKYLLVKQIGRGGMGTVWEAEDIELKRKVALKILKDSASDSRSIKRFQREGTIAAQFHHPNVVPVYEVGTIANPDQTFTHFIAMAYVAGNTLAELIEEGSTPLPELIRMLEETARAIDYCHHHGVIHRDMKPANVLIDPEGRAQVTDFGLAHAELFETQLTRTQAVMGTPGYMAPEQVRGATKEIDARTDVYALGAVLYEILTRRIPFTGQTAASVYDKILHEEPAPPTKVGRAVPADLEVVCLKALDKDPARRFSRAADFAEDLARWRRGEAIVARPPTVRLRLSKAIARRKIVVVASVLLVVGVGTALAFMLPKLRKSEQLAASKHRQVVEEMRGRAADLLDSALNARRAGRVEEMQKQATRLEELCAKVQAEVPDAPDPYYLRGRMLRARMKYDAALSEQDRALAKDPAYGPARYERIVLNSYWVRYVRVQATSKALQTGARDLDSIGKGDLELEMRPDPRLDAAREAVAKDFEALRALSPELRQVTDVQYAVAQAMAAISRGEDEGAAETLERLVSAPPVPEETYESLLFLSFRREDFPRVIELTNAAIETDRGFAAYYEWRSRARLQIGMRKAVTDPASIAELDIALEDAGRALAADPTRASSEELKGTIHFQRGSRRRAQGQDPVPDLQAAVEIDRKRVAESPNWGNHVSLAGALMTLGGILSDRGLDPIDAYQEGAENFAAALKIDDGLHRIWNWRGTCYRNAAAWLRGKGQEAKAIGLDLRAIEFFTEAVKREPKNANAWYARGLARYYMAMSAKSPSSPEVRAILDREKAAHPALIDQAISDYDQAVKLPQATGDFFYRRAQAYHQRADALGSQRDQAEVAERESIASATRALELQPERADFVGIRLDAAIGLSFMLMARKEDPESVLAMAEKDAAELIRLRPTMANGTWIMGRVHMNRGLFLEFTKQDASAPYRKALEWFEKAAAMDPRGAEGMRRFMDQARIYLERNRPPEEPPKEREE